MLKVDRNTPAVAVHGITRDQSIDGMPEPQAMELFLDYVKDGVIVGHHIGHDMATFDAACQRHWGATLLNRSLDTMDLTLHLERDGAFAGRPPIRRFTLDALCEMFGVIPHDRHTATGDAFITAQVFLGWCAWQRREAGARSAGSASHSRFQKRRRRKSRHSPRLRRPSRPSSRSPEDASSTTAGFCRIPLVI